VAAADTASTPTVRARTPVRAASGPPGEPAGHLAEPAQPERPRAAPGESPRSTSSGTWLTITA
jgi:hypothetical protein